MEEILINRQKTGDMFRVLIGHLEHAVVISTPQRNEVAIVADGESVAINASIYKIFGCGRRASVENPGCISLGYRLYMIRAGMNEDMEESAPVKYMSLISQWGNMTAMQIKVTADRNTAGALDGEISLFPEKEQMSVRGAVYAFGNYGGRIAAVKVLRAAHEKGRLKQALKIFGLNWKVAVRNQSPLFAGDPAYEKSRECWEYFCRNIGIPLPFSI